MLVRVYFSIFYSMIRIILMTVCLILWSCSSEILPISPAVSTSGEAKIHDPYTIGSVDTAFQLIGPDHKIEVGGVPDPKIAGITCFYSRAKTGGIIWWLGLAENTSDASVACRQTGKISFREAIKSSEEIWNERSSIFFKRLRIVRFYDKSSNSLIYLVYSDKLIDGSPKNSISAVALEDILPIIQ